MKIYNEVVIDAESGKVIWENSFEYQGEVALCKGGGSSGRVDYPTYLKNIHADLLNGANDDTGTDITIDLISAMNTAMSGGSPFSADSAYDPTTRIAEADAAVCAFDTAVDALDHEADWEAAIEAVDTELDSVVLDSKYNLSTRVAAIDAAIAALDHEQDWEDAVAAAVTAIDNVVLVSAYNPGTKITNIETAIANLTTIAEALATGYTNYEDTWDDAISSSKAQLDALVFDDTYINADVAAFQANLNDYHNNVVLPDLQTGLRDVNAVYSSAFVMAETYLNAMRTRDSAKYETGLREKLHIMRDEHISRGAEAQLKLLMESSRLLESVIKGRVETANVVVPLEGQRNDIIKAGIEAQLRSLLEILKTKLEAGRIEAEYSVRQDSQRYDLIKNAVQIMLSNLIERVRLEQAVAHYTIEADRIGIVAFKEQTDQDILIEDIDARWDLDVFHYASNMLASIGGGTSHSVGGANMSKTQSALSGALAGASVGATVAQGPGAAIGAALGGIGGLLM